MIEKPQTENIESKMMDEWTNLEDNINNKLIPLCKKNGFEMREALLEYLLCYSKLNYEYNIAHKRYLSGDVVDIDVSISNANLALTQVENKLYANLIRAKNDYGYYD